MSRGRVIIIAVAVLLGTAGLALTLWLAGRALEPWLTRERLERELSAALGRPVRVAGVAIEPWRGRVAVDGLAVAAGPTWESGVVLQVPRLTLGVRLESFWRRELVLGALADKPVARLVATQGPGGLDLPASVPERIVLGPVTVRLSAVEVAGGTVGYADSARGLELTVSGVDARVSPVGGGLDLHLRAGRLTLSRAGGVHDLDDLEVTGNLRHDHLHLRQARGRFSGERLELSGDVTDLVGDARLALTVRGRVALGALAGLGLLPVALDGTARVEGEIGGRAAIPTAAVRFAVSRLRGAAVQARNVQGRLAWDGATLALSEVSGETLGGRVSGTLVLPGADPAQAHARVRVERVALAAVQALAGRDLGVQGALTGEAELRGDVRRPLDGRGQVRLSADGVTLPGALAPLGRGAVAAEAQVRDGGLDVARLEATWPAARGLASGRATPAGAERLRVTLTTDLAPVLALAGWPVTAGTAVVTTEAHGPWTAPRVAGRAHVTGLEAAGHRIPPLQAPFTYADRTLRLDGAETGLGESRVVVTGLARLPAEASLSLAGLRRALRLEADLRVPAARLEDLAPWLPEGWPASGPFGATARLEGTVDAWRAWGQASAPRLEVRGETVADAAVAFSAGAAGLEISRFAAHVRGVPLVGSALWQWDGTGTVRAEAAATGLHALLGDWPALAPTGRVRGRGEATIGAGAVSASVTLTADGVALAGVTLGDGQGQASLRRGRIDAEVRFPAARVTATASGRLDGGPLDVRVAAHDVDARPLLTRWVPQVDDLAARGSLSADLRVPPADPAATQGTVRLDPLLVEAGGETWQAQGPVVIERAAGTTRLRPSTLTSPIGSLALSGSVEDGGALDLAVRGRLPLALLPTLRPEVREAAGALEATVRVGGRLQAPELGGEGTVSGGRLVLTALDDPLRDVNARFTVSPGGLRLVEATATYAGGTLRARGDVALAGARVRGYRTELVVRRVAAEPIAGLHTVWDADLELVGGPERGQVRGEARLLRGRYDRDLSLVRLLLDRRPAGAPGAGGLHLDVQVALLDNLSVTTDVARLRVGGTLQVQGTTGAPIVFGTLSAREGQLVFRRHRFEVTRAAARFADPRRIDPILDVQAVARIGTYEVRLQISGPSESVEVRLASTPPLPEEDLLTLVAFGLTREQVARSGGGVLVGEAAGLLVRELFGARAGQTGLDVLEVERAPETGATTVRVGKEIAPRTLVVYSQSIENVEERRLRLEYQVIGPLAVAGEQDFRGGFGADVLVRVRFR